MAENNAAPFKQSWEPDRFEEITDLLAEALFLDFQEHVRATVNSPQGTNHTILLTTASDKAKGFQALGAG